MTEENPNPPALSPELETLLKDLRRYIADSKDDWEKRRELLDRINGVLPGGEMEMFVAAVREMGRMGTNYANMMQTFNQLFATQQAGAQFADLFTRGLAGNPFLSSGMAPNAFDLWRQMAEFVATQARTFNPNSK